MQFEYPYAVILLLLPLIIVLHFYLFKIHKKSAYLKFSVVARQNIFSTESLRSHLFLWLKVSVLVLFILAAMAPYKTKNMVSINQFGVDIVLALDVSESMRARDMQPINRLGAAKKVLEEFINKRKKDRLGLIVFGAEAYVQSPQTSEFSVLLEIVKTVQLGIVNGRRTAIGDALAISASRLLDSKIKNKIIILITDGADTAPDKIRPIAATGAIADLGIKVYTIGIGSTKSRYQIDFDLLKKISNLTGGKFYNASNYRTLSNSFNDIDQMEKSIINRKKYNERNYYTLNYIYFGLILFILIVITEKIIWSRRLE